MHIYRPTERGMTMETEDPKMSIERALSLVEHTERMSRAAVEHAGKALASAAPSQIRGVDYAAVERASGKLVAVRVVRDEIADCGGDLRDLRRALTARLVDMARWDRMTTGTERGSAQLIGEVLAIIS